MHRVLAILKMESRDAERGDVTVHHGWASDDPEQHIRRHVVAESHRKAQQFPS